MPIDTRNLNQYGLFNLFWNTHGDPDLSGGGLNEVSAQGAQKLFEYARDHDLNGGASPAARKVIGEDEKELIKALLEHPRYRAFFEQDGRVKLMQLFGIRAEDIHNPNALKPEDIGELRLPGHQSVNTESRLATVHIKELPKMFEDEYKRNKAKYEAGAGTDEEKGSKVLALLRDYTAALWSNGEHPETEAIGHSLLDAFEKCRYSKVVGGNNYNGAPWSAAQSLVLGLDPNKFDTDFPKAGGEGKTTYLHMGDDMAEPMSYVDKYLEKKGKKAGAKEYELQSPLGFMIGQPNGHNKAGSLTEETPFSTSGLNWGVVLFPGDAEIAKLKPKEGFEFKIDCLDGIGNFLRCDPKYGERIKVLGANGDELKVEKQIQREGGKAVSWTAKFTDARGKEVKPEDVLGVFVDRNGRVKGDKKATKEVDMWWWGFCDRNTAQKLYKIKYNIPELDGDAKIKVKVGRETIEVPKATAQMLIDCDIPDIVSGETMCGFRFNDEPQRISLKNGTVLTGKTAGDILENAPGVQRLNEDVIAVFNDAKRPLLGTIDVQTEYGLETINVRDIKTIEKDAHGKVTVKVGGDYEQEFKGTLKSDVDFAHAERHGDKQLLKQDSSYPIRGDLKIDLINGESKTVHVKDVSQIAGETSKDLRISQFTTWVSANKGNFATDAMEKEVVSNGMRWVNKIDQDVRYGDDRPEWAGQGDLQGINGKLERQDGDSITWVRGQYSYQAGQPADSTTFAGWVHTSKHGRILNEGFTEGQPDFGWSANGKLNWLANSSFNPFVDPEMRLGLLVNGVKKLKTDGADTAALAEQLGLPANWKDYRA